MCNTTSFCYFHSFTPWKIVSFHTPSHLIHSLSLTIEIQIIPSHKETLQGSEEKIFVKRSLLNLKILFALSSHRQPCSKHYSVPRCTQMSLLSEVPYQKCRNEVPFWSNCISSKGSALVELIKNKLIFHIDFRKRKTCFYWKIWTSSTPQWIPHSNLGVWLACISLLYMSWFPERVIYQVKDINNCAIWMNKTIFIIHRSGRDRFVHRRLCVACPMQYNMHNKDRMDYNRLQCNLKIWVRNLTRVRNSC